MTIKEYLSQGYRIDQRIKSKLEQIKNLRELATKVTTTLNSTGVSKTKNVHQMEDVIIKMLDLEGEINADIDMLIKVKKGIMAMIKKVENPEYQTLLELRYLCLKKWEQIAVEMGYDLRWIHRLHNKALEKISH